MTGKKILAFVRILLGETVEDQILDANIEIALNLAFDEWVGKIQHKYAEWYFKTGTIMVSADSRTKDLPTDCTGVIKNVFLNDVELPPQAFSKMYADGTGLPSRYALMGDTIWLNTTVSVDTDLVLNYYYIPTDIDVTDDTDQIGFPKLDHAILAYEAALPIAMRNTNYTIIPHLIGKKKELETTLWSNMANRIKGRPMGTKLAGNMRRTTAEVP